MEYKVQNKLSTLVLKKGANELIILQISSFGRDNILDLPSNEFQIENCFLNCQIKIYKS